MDSIKIGQTRLLGYLPTILIQYILEKDLKGKKPPLYKDITTVSLFADISGFTKLSESFSKKGRTGSEFLAFCLNRYMELLINIIGNNGGDIIKFAGDALLVIWPQEKCDNSITACRRAVQCAIHIMRKLDGLEMIKGRKLSVKVGLGFGKCKILLVGGKFERFECLVVGESMRQACCSECHCNNGGQIVVCQSVYELIKEFFLFEEAPPDTEHKPADDLKYYLFKKIIKDEKVQKRADAFLLRNKFLAKDLKLKYNELKKYVPAAIAIYLDIEQEIWSKESRLLTIMFLNLTIDLTHTKKEDGLKHIQNVIGLVQRCIYRTCGSLNKFLMDDKGSVLLIGWGLPPLSNHDDPLRAVLTGLNIIQELKNYKSEKWGICGAKIGITTGCCFSGVCGNIGNRREYSLLGEIVNLSARYMQQSIKICDQEKKQFQLLLCKNTKNLIQYQIYCKWVCKGMCKGFANEFDFYEPIIEQSNINLPYFSLIKTRRDNPIINSEGNADKNSTSESLFIVGRQKEILIIMEEMENFVKNISVKNKSKIILIKGHLGCGKSLLVRKVLVEFFEHNLQYLPKVKDNYKFLFCTSQLPTTLTKPFNGCSSFLKKIYKIISLNNYRILNIKKNIDDVEIVCDSFGDYLMENNYFKLINFLDEILDINILGEHFSIPEDKIEIIKKKYILYFDDPQFDPFFNRRNYNDYLKYLLDFFIGMIKEYCEKYIKNCPLLLIIEDTHLIDNCSISLINKINELSNTFIICTYQTSLNPYDKQKQPALICDKIIELTGLCYEEDCLKLIHHFFKYKKNLSVKNVNRKTLFYILSRSFGNNPLFIIEIVDSLFEQNQIEVEKTYGELISTPTFMKYCQLLDWGKLNIPFIIEKIVGNIIDSLKCPEIITLKHASVIGTIFDLDKLYKLNIINTLNSDSLKQMIYQFSEDGLLEILFDLDPKKIVVKFAIPFLKEILYKRMLVETKNEIHLKTARLMETAKFSYVPRSIEKQLLNYHLIEEETTILDHLADTNDNETKQILKEANQRIKCVKETIDTVKDIDTRALNFDDINFLSREFSFFNEKDEIGEVENKENETEEKVIVSKSNMPIVKGGLIEKKSDKGITWEKRFVIISKTKFYYWYKPEEYILNKQYLGMFELKNIYAITALKDFEFGQKKNILQLKVSSFYKKDKLKDGRDYIFSFKSRSEMNEWIITLNLLRAKAIYDEYINTYGVINFPFNHEKIRKEDKRKIKRIIHCPNPNNNYFQKKKTKKVELDTIKDSAHRPLIETKKTKMEKVNSVLDEEEKVQKENELAVKLKEKIEFLFPVTFAYYFGSLQRNLIYGNKNEEEFTFREPLRIKLLMKSKNYIKLQKDLDCDTIGNDKEKNDNNRQLIHNIKGGADLPNFNENEKLLLDSKNSPNGRIIDDNKIKSMSSSEKEEKKNMGINALNSRLKLNIKDIGDFNENENKEKKDSDAPTTERELNARDKLKNLNMEIGSKNLEKQLKELFAEHNS